MRIPSPQRHEGAAFYLTQIFVPLCITIVLSLFTGLFYGFGTDRSSTSHSLTALCDANGNVHLQHKESSTSFNNYWDPRFFLGITLGFGSFSFATVRVIDGFWDVVVGRCGQVVLSLLAYPVLRRSLNAEMERAQASLPLFASLAFDKVSITPAWRILRDHVCCGRWSARNSKDKRGHRPPGIRSSPRQNLRAIGWFLVLVYLLAFPTMTAIITGYQPRYSPYVSPPDSDNLVPISDFKIAALLMLRGEAQGFPSPMVIDPSIPDPEIQTLYSYWETCARDLPVYITSPFPTGYPRNRTCPMDACTCTVDVYTTDAERFPTDDPTNLTTSRLPTSGNLVATASTIKLPDRTVDFKVEDEEPRFFGQCAADRYTEQACMGGGDVYLTDGNQTLTQDYIQTHGFCRPLNRYRWGFSSLALLTHLLISITAALILTALHFDAFCNGKTDRRIYDHNLYSDAVAVSRELDRLPFGRPLEEVPGSELKDAVERAAARVRIDEVDDLLPRREGWLRWGWRSKQPVHEDGVEEGKSNEEQSPHRQSFLRHA